MILGVAFGGPWIAVVALKTIAAETGGARSVPAFASSLAWFGAGLGGIAMGWLADRYGVRWTVMFGAVMIAIGLAISSLGPSTWQLYLGHGLFIGLLGNAGLNAPLYVYVSRWFDRRRGSALALIASGQYIAGAIWPPIFERAIAAYGWRDTMLVFGAVRARRDRAARAIFLKRPPEVLAPRDRVGASGAADGARLAAQSGVRHDGARGLLLLHADVDAAGASGRAVQRSRHHADARRRDAVDAARHRASSAARCGAGSPIASAACMTVLAGSVWQFCSIVALH